jgi:[acyl-carrier-protein] S-malonyltransferase
LATARIDAMASARDCHLAILNAPDSVVIGGERGALGELCAEAVAAGAQRAVLLPVHTPSHTPLLSDATERFRATLAEAPRLQPRGGPRLLSGLDGAPVFSAEAGMEKLAQQISRTIDWAACLEAAREDGADAILELGPGHALATMAQAALPDARVHAIEDFRSIAGVTGWIRET